MPIAIESLISSMEWAARSNLGEYAFEIDGRRVTLRRGAAGGPATAAVAAVHQASAVPAMTTAEADHHAIGAPLSGSVYLAKDTGSAPFVRVGDQVSKGQTVCLIEAMKVMTSVSADRDGTVVEIAVEDGAPVEAGDVLMKVRA